VSEPNGSLRLRGERPIVFGPMRSRRLGQSLAVDVIPRKACPLDCIYCELGKTNRLSVTRQEFVSPDAVIRPLREFLRDFRGTIDHITLSASGEPTLNIRLGEIITRIRELTVIPIAVLTNGVLLDRPDVRKDLSRADVVLPSLDAATEETFLRINRPHPRVVLEKVISGLASFRREYHGKIWLEVLFVKGVNDQVSELTALRKAVGMIRPDRVDLNTVVRAPAERNAVPVGRDRLRAIGEILGPFCHIP